MLQLVLLAFLAIGCTCVKKYTIEDGLEYEDAKAPELFPMFVPDYDNNFSIDFNFVVHHMPNNALTFLALLDEEQELGKPVYKAHFSTPEGGLILSSFQFRFTPDGEYRMYVEVKSTTEDKHWIVRSKLLLPPTEESASAHADDNYAVRANTVDEEVADYLDEQHNAGVPLKRVSFSVEWILRLLVLKKPKRIYTRTTCSKDSPIKFFMAVPVLADDDVLKKLNALRVKMPVTGYNKDQ